MTDPTTEAIVAKLMALHDAAAEQAVKEYRTTVDTYDGPLRPESRAALESFARGAIDQGPVVAWRAKAQCGMYEGMWEFSEDATDLIHPEPLYAGRMTP